MSLPEEVRYYLTPSDQQQVEAILAELPPPLCEPLVRSVHAAAVCDARSLSALLPVLGPILRTLPAESRAVLLQRTALLSQSFPAAVVPLFRSLGRVYDEVGEERTLAWIATGEEIARRGPEAGAAFFALKSRTSILTLRGAFPHVYLSDVQGVLLKFLHMLSGEAIGLIETERFSFPPPLAEGESEVVPLPFCIDRFPSYEENFRLYRVLVAHQVGRVEFGTYACVPSRLWSSLAPLLTTLTNIEVTPPADLASYFQLFPRPDLIQTLFLCIEGKRIVARLAPLYPGLQADLSWAESLTELLPSEIPTVLSRIANGTWLKLCNAGTVDDSLVLATRLYARFLRHESIPAVDVANPVQEDFEDVAEEGMGFITGVDLGRGSKAASSLENLKSRHRRALTTADLRYVYDEWDYEIEDYRPHWCEVRETPLLGDGGAFFSQTLTTYADLITDIKREFQRLRPRMHQQVKGLEDGEEIDLNAVVAAHVDRRSGVSPSLKVYSARQVLERDVAVLFLLDLSSSTAVRLPAAAATAASALRQQEGPRVIDLIKEAVALLAVALEEIGDAYAIYGFSSSGRHDIEIYPVKNFKESLSLETQGRIGALTPQGSTRMGAAVRHATRRLKSISSRSRLLVVLSDGYPEDEDYGKPVIPPLYGLRDTLMALREAERGGITSFFLTIDKGGHDYLREMCPSSRYMVIEDVHSLPAELPKIYQRHIWSQWV
jgi:Mg-chelatase subunit ChlD